ncbi:hypothetical protein BKA93DRAFT_160401 [Sparassis latifolia]
MEVPCIINQRCALESARAAVPLVCCQLALTDCFESPGSAVLHSSCITCMGLVFAWKGASVPPKWIIHSEPHTKRAEKNRDTSVRQVLTRSVEATTAAHYALRHIIVQLSLDFYKSDNVTVRLAVDLHRYDERSHERVLLSDLRSLNHKMALRFLRHPLSETGATRTL